VVHTAALSAYAISAGTGEAAMWGALVVALFSLIAGAPIMAKFWLKPPPQKVAEPVPGQARDADPAPPDS